METKTITIERTFNLPLSKVWEAWTEEESFKKWWGPKNYSCPDCTIDFKEGGKYTASMEDKDGKLMWSTGLYQEILPGKRIVMTDSFSDSNGNIISASDARMPGEWPKSLLITLEFHEYMNTTIFLLKQEGMPVEMYDDCMEGWKESFDKLEENLK